MHFYKDCIKIQFQVGNNNAEGGKYFDQQISATYYGTKTSISGQFLSDIAKQIDNGIKRESNLMAIQDFLYLFGQGGLPGYSHQMQRISDSLENNKEISYAEVLIEFELDAFPKGGKKQITVNAYERNPQARAKCIEHHEINCQVCGFSFEQTYGEIGKDYIHMHHIKPLY